MKPGRSDGESLIGPAEVVSPPEVRADLRPGWLAGSGAVFGRLVETIPWRAEKRHMYDKVVKVPRLLCFYGEDAPLPDPVLTAAREALNAHLGARRPEDVPAGRAADQRPVPAAGRTLRPPGVH